MPRPPEPPRKQGTICNLFWNWCPKNVDYRTRVLLYLRQNRYAESSTDWPGFCGVLIGSPGRNRRCAGDCYERGWSKVRAIRRALPLVVAGLTALLPLTRAHAAAPAMVV